MRTHAILGITGALLILWVAEGLAQQQPAVDTPAARRQAVQTYLALVPMREFMRDGVEELAKQLPPADRPSFIAVMTTAVRTDVLEQAAAESLAKHLTVQEIHTLIEFMERPEGKSAAAKMKYYMADLMPVMQQEVARVLQRLQAEHVR